MFTWEPAHAERWPCTGRHRRAPRLSGRDYVIPDDVKALAEATLAHRIIVGPNARIKDISSSSIVQNILNMCPCARSTVGTRY